MGAGRRAIERAWATDATFAVTLTGSLVGSGWKAFDQFALPRFLSESLQHLEQSQAGDDNGELPIRIQILRVLAELAKNGSLKDTDDAWRTRFAVWLQAWLSDFQFNDFSVCIIIPEVVKFLTTRISQVLMLRELTWLVPVLSAQDLHPYFAAKAKQLLDDDSGFDMDRKEDLVNSAWIFGQMLCLASSKKSSNPLSVEDSLSLVFRAILRWSWSEFVVQSLLRFASTL